MMTMASVKNFFCLPIRAIEFLLLLLGYFFYSIRWGGENEQVLLQLGWLQILVTLWALARYKFSMRGFLTFVTIFLAMACAQIFYPQIISEAKVPGDVDLYLVAAVRLYVYLLFVCLHALTMRKSDGETFINCFLWLSRASVVVAAVSMLLYWVFDIPVLLNFYFAQGIVRPQAFLSEPSAFAPLIGCLLIFGWRRKKLLDIMLAITGMGLALSPITIIGGVGAFLVYLLFYGARDIFVKCGVIMVLIVAFAFINSLDCRTLVISGESMERTLGRVSCGIQVLYDRELKSSLEGVFYNERLESTITSINFLQDNGLMETGAGLNSSSIFMPILYGEVRENSLWLSVLLFYGIYGLLAVALLCIYALVKISRVNQGMAAIFLTLLVSATINSAGGFYMYSLLFWSMCYSLSPACKRSPVVTWKTLKASSHTP